MKKRILKSSIITFSMSLIVALNIIIVGAASFSVSRSASSVSPGGSFTVTISASGAGQFSVSASNGSVSSSSVWVDGSASVTCTAGQAGTTTVTVTAIDATGYDESPITGSQSTSVSIKSPASSSGSSSSSSSNNSSSSTTTTVQEPEVKKSSEKNLSSLSVSEGTLSPKFSAGTTTYKVDLTNEVKKLTISAKAKDSKARVSGTGEKELKIGENNFTVTVTAEDGSKKTYTISVYVTEKPTQFVKLGDQSLGILNDLSKVDVPKGFEKTTIKIDDKDVTALQNKDLGLTLLYLQTEDEKTGFYIYDVDNNKVLRQYQTLTVNGKTYVIMDAPENLEEVQGLEKSTIKIGDLEMNGWKFNEETLSHYTLVYLMNDAGESGLYTYEDTEGTLQKYTPVEEKDNTLTYVFIGTTVVFALSTAVVGYMYFNFKKKSISAIKDYYDKKNQG